MIIALASPYRLIPRSGLRPGQAVPVRSFGPSAEIVSFPEAYLPGLRGQDFEVLPFDQTQQERALQAVEQWARTYAVSTIDVLRNLQS